ncbi:MAG: hypothetical protein U0168_17660 [Nannocystaceae bacterium]
MSQLLATIEINGLRLPASLGAALHDGRWRRPSDARLERVFRERPSALVMFDLPTMRRVNRRWREETNPAFFGHPDDRAPPGDICPGRSLWLGLLGPDTPFALDYRQDIAAPAVVSLHSGGDRWITVAADVERLLARLGLDRAASARAPRKTSPMRAPHGADET